MKKAKRYTVTVLRIGYATRDIEVFATSKKQAGIEAIDIAGDFEFSEHSSDYIAKETFLKENTNA
jgi:hypothetical protein